MALTGVSGAIAHICAATDALIDYDEERTRRAQKLLDEALDQLAPHPDTPEVFRFTEDRVEMKVLASPPPRSPQEGAD